MALLKANAGQIAVVAAFLSEGSAVLHQEMGCGCTCSCRDLFWMQHCIFLYPLAWALALQVREARTCPGGEQEGQQHAEWVCWEGGGQHVWKAFFVMEREILFVLLFRIEW